MSFHHLHRPPKGDNNRTFVLLHGTGADEYDLLPLAAELDPTAGILSIRGNVVQDRLTRWFRCPSNFEYDQQSMREQTDKLQEFLTEFTKTQNLKPSTNIFLGYSAGAIMIQSLLFRYPKLVHTALCFHPMLPFEPKSPLNLNHVKMLITSGKQDEYLRTPDEIEQMTSLLKKSGAKVTTFIHPGGHELIPVELEAAREMLVAVVIPVQTGI